MNLPGNSGQAPDSNLTSTVLFHESIEEGKREQEGVAQDDQAETSDLAKLLGAKICRKTGLKQLFFSFSVDRTTTQEFMKNFRMMMATEQKIT